MKKILFILVSVMMLTQGCSYHYYYGYNEAETPSPYYKDTKARKAESGKQAAFEYDRTAPDIKPPTPKRPATKYDPTDYNTFAVYGDMHTVEPPHEGESGVDLYAIWCTKEATYLVKKDAMMWNERFFQEQSATFLRDSRTGEMYQLRKVWGLPLNETYWIHGVAGEWFCRVFEFPPLKPECGFIDIVYSLAPELEQVKGATGWGRSKDVTVSVKYLQQNQPKMKYKKTVVVE